MSSPSQAVPPNAPKPPKPPLSKVPLSKVPVAVRTIELFDKNRNVVTIKKGEPFLNVLAKDIPKNYIL